MHRRLKAIVVGDATDHMSVQDSQNRFHRFCAALIG